MDIDESVEEDETELTRKKIVRDVGGNMKT